MFRVGQKVVCVDLTSSAPGTTPGLSWHPDCDVPVVGNIYIIRALGERRGAAGLKLEEIRWRGHENGVWFDDGFYWAARFLPIVERKTDISIFTKILDDVRDKTPAMS